MRKYLAYYENEWPANIAELTAVENKPFVGYLKGEGVQFTVIPPPTPETWKIYYTSTDGNVVTPKFTTGFGANLVSNTYENGQGVMTFDGPVKTIGLKPFNMCESLTSISIPESVTSVESRAFESCPNLRLVEWNAPTITDVTASASSKVGPFWGCSNLEQVIFGPSVEIIPAYLFAEVSGKSFDKLTHIQLPDTIRRIGEYAFSGTGFYKNKSNWEDGVLYINNYLIFAKAEIEGEYVVKDNTVTIGGMAFYTCSKLTAITLPVSVKNVGYQAFSTSNNSSLVRTNYTGDLAHWCDIWFYPTSQAVATSNPISKTKNLYINDQEIKNLIIPDGVEIIRNFSFVHCQSLVSVTIPQSVTKINMGAFRGCTNITQITYNGTMEEWGAITKGSGWKALVPATYVQCSDGQVTL